MKLTEYRKNYAVDNGGQWFQKIDGKWHECDVPKWWTEERAERARKEDEKEREFRMTPPKGEQVKTVKIMRVLEKEVPDYEAEVLVRNGWFIVPDSPEGIDAEFDTP